MSTTLQYFAAAFVHISRLLGWCLSIVKEVAEARLRGSREWKRRRMAQLVYIA